jgi:hypothetical protein
MATSKGEGAFGIIAAVTGVLALIVAILQFVHDVYGVGPAPVTSAVNWATGESGSTVPQSSPDGGDNGIPGFDREPPTTPQNLRIESRNGCSVTLKWDPSEDNVSVENYRIFDGSQFKGHVEEEFTTHEVLMFPGDEHGFTVMAVDGRNNQSELSNVVRVPPC